MDDLSASRTGAAKSEYRLRAMAPTPGSSPSSTPKQTYDYDGHSHCKNRGRYAEMSICKADESNCVFYKKIKRSGNEWVGVCSKRYDAKLKKNSAQAADIKKTQDISTYNRRRT